MSEDNIASPGNESHQLQAPGVGFDCTGIIKQVIEQASAKHANTIIVYCCVLSILFLFVFLDVASFIYIYI